MTLLDGESAWTVGDGSSFLHRTSIEVDADDDSPIIEARPPPTRARIEKLRQLAADLLATAEGSR